MVKKIAFTLLLFSSSLPSLASTLPETEIRNQLKQTLSTLKKDDSALRDFYRDLSKNYGDKALPALEKTVLSESESDEARYIALFAYARVASPDAHPKLEQLIRTTATHRSWVLRDASLRTIAGLQLKHFSSALEKALQDPSLVVRTTAVDAIAHLKLTNLAPKICGMLKEERNYHREKPLWITSHILSALKTLRNGQIKPELHKIIAASKDAVLKTELKKIIQSL